MLSAWLVSLAASTTMVPPDSLVENHAHPGHSAQPTVQLFERRMVDRSRRNAWEAYCLELDDLWIKFREKGNAPGALSAYKTQVNAAKTRYLYQDPYLLPIIDEAME